MHIRRPRAMRASVGRAGCALAAARARASVALAAHWLVAACCRTAARASVGRAGCALAAAARCASIGHACCARLLCEVRRRALRTRTRARAETGSGKGVRVRCVHASEVGEEDDSNNDGERTCERRAYHHDGPATPAARSPSTRPTSAHESQGVCARNAQAALSSRTLTLHAQAARSGRTLRLHAQALRLRVSWRRHLEDNKDRRCRSMAAVGAGATEAR